jgi:hypothetical protein
LDATTQMIVLDERLDESNALTSIDDVDENNYFRVFRHGTRFDGVDFSRASLCSKEGKNA